MKILITGANGFLGKHVVDRFKQSNGHILKDISLSTFSSKQFNLTDPNEAAMLFEQERPDVVIHLAAIVGGIKWNMNNPFTMIHENLKIAVNLFECIYKYNIKYLYSTESVCSYPVNIPTPFKEDDLWNGKSELTNFYYAESKKSLITLFDAYRKQYGLKGANLILANLYGPHNDFDLENSHVIAALIRKFVEASEKNLPHVYCWGTGTAEREFLFASDAAKAIVCAVLREFDYEYPINIGTGKATTIKELAYLIGKLTNYNGEIVFTGEVSDGQKKRQLDVSKAKELLDFEAEIDLTVGLQKTIDWYIKNKENLNGR